MHRAATLFVEIYGAKAAEKGLALAHAMWQRDDAGAAARNMEMVEIILEILAGRSPEMFDAGPSGGPIGR